MKLCHRCQRWKGRRKRVLTPLGITCKSCAATPDLRREVVAFVTGKLEVSHGR